MIKYGYNNYTTEHFDKFLKEIQEVGYVESYNLPVVRVNGLPRVKPREILLFENGALAQVMSLHTNFAEAVLLSQKPVSVGERVCRTDKSLEIGLGKYLLGKVLDPLGRNVYLEINTDTPEEYRYVDTMPPGIEKRVKINQFFETGVAVVDMLVPLGKGQRELIIGDRKTGKTEFILQTLLNQAKQGTICIYAGVGKYALDIKKIEHFLDAHNIRNNTVIFVSYASDPSILIHLTPYAAMTTAEYFMEQGHDVLLILDDMTDHAKHYRELALMSNKFPGRSAYPGDIFYVQSRLLERAGYYKTQKGINSITCLPLAESVQGDTTGYIQTNLMSITDGHIFFDQELFLQGMRPPVNYFLSVTRVGRQTQTKLKWSVGRELGSFLTLLENTKSFVHFGAEINEGIKSTLSMGDRVYDHLLNQRQGQILPSNLQIFIFCLIWSQLIKDSEQSSIADQKQKIIDRYNTDPNYKTKVDKTIAGSEDLNKLLGVISSSQSEFI